jgi:hypothetical protein
MFIGLERIAATYQLLCNVGPSTSVCSPPAALSVNVPLLLSEYQIYGIHIAH